MFGCATRHSGCSRKCTRNGPGAPGSAWVSVNGTPTASSLRRNVGKIRPAVRRRAVSLPRWQPGQWPHGTEMRTSSLSERTL